MKFLTMLNGDKVYYNSINTVREPIAGEHPGANAVVNLAGQNYYVKDTVEEVLSK